MTSACPKWQHSLKLSVGRVSGNRYFINFFPLTAVGYKRFSCVFNRDDFLSVFFNDLSYFSVKKKFRKLQDSQNR